MKNFFMFGLAGAGKDTVGELVRRYFDLYTLALADPIREEYVEKFGTSDFKQNRDRMIAIGEGYKKIYGQDVWCESALKKVSMMNEVTHGVIHMTRLAYPFRGALILDGRYQHEYDFFVGKHGFTPVRLVADREVRLERLQVRDGNAQLKALEFEKQNFISDASPALMLENNGTKDDLLDNLCRVLKLKPIY